MLTFALGGKASLPPAEHEVPPLLDDPNFVVDDKKAALGMAVFHRNCHVCHGPRLIAGGAAPDLRRAMTPMYLDALSAVLRDGSLRTRGMPQFEEMPAEEVEGVMHYVRQQARAALAAERQ